MSKARPTTRENRLSKALKSVQDWKAGKKALKAWSKREGAEPRFTYQTYEEYRQIKNPGQKLKKIRETLGLPQSSFAIALRTSIRTLQGWEIGKSVPTTALVLAELLRDSKDVRSRLLA